MMKRKGFLVIICLVLCLLVPGVYANTVSITPANVQHQIGETQSFNVILDSAPEGLSGFNITIAVQNPAVAQIIGISYNTSWAFMPKNSSVPASSIWCKVGDLEGKSGTVNITLVTILVRADSVGTTEITINPERVEDRIGGRYSPSVMPATLTAIVGTNRPSLIGVFRPSTHLFYLDYNGNGVWNGASVDRQNNFGLTGDTPLTGDWNIDGRTEIGVFRNSTHLFYLDYNGNGVWNGASMDRQYNFGLSGDIPVSGDWNYDGKFEIGVFRPSTHTFYLEYNGNGAWNGAFVDKQCNFGLTGDIPVSGDWNSDGRTEIGVFRNSTHLFYLDYNGNCAWNGASVDRQYNFGITGDLPVTGDWNSDGRTDIGVFRPSTHLFYLDYNGNGIWNGGSVDKQYNFGLTGDVPVSGKWTLPPQQTFTNIQMIGNVYGLSTDNQTLTTILFTIGLAPGSPAMDLTTMTIVFSTPTTTPKILSQTSGNATTELFTTKIGSTPVSSMNTTDQVLILFNVAGVPVNTRMNFELRPSAGAALPFTKTAPATITNTNVLY